MKSVLLDRLQPLALAAALVPSGMALSGLALSCMAFSPAALVAQAAKTAARTDGQIEMDVVQALDDSAALKNDLITAATIQSKITLSGTVASQANKDLAQSIVAKVPGVTGVVNNLKIGDPAQAASQEELPAPGDDQPAEQAQNQAPQYQGQAAPPADNYPQQGAQQQYPQQQPYPQQPSAQQGGAYPPPYPAPGSRPQYSPNGASGYGAPPNPAYGDGYGHEPYGQQQAEPAFAIPTGPVTVAQGTLLQLRTTDNVDSKRAKPGETLDFMVIRDVAVNGFLAIPRGATIHGVVTDVQETDRVSGTPGFGLRLTSLELNGRQYPVVSDVFRVRGPSKTTRTVGNTIGTALVGALIGGVAGGGSGAAIGAGAGGAAGMAASAASPNPHAWIPAEALVSFHVQQPLTLDPVSQDEASRLAAGLYQGGPSLHQRGPGGYGYGPNAGPYMYAYPAPYGYPPIYYRPYFRFGGGYYWR